ncbi:MAG TPA: PDZ domain-containing protein, partial [Chthoniobacterales bacterium]
DFMAALYLHPIDQVMKIDVLRGTNQMSFNVPVVAYHEKIDELADVPNLQKTLIRKLSIFVTDLDATVKPLLPSTRSASGILVVAQTAGPNADTGLATGDIIRAIDQTPVQSMTQFQEMVRSIRSGDPVVLQVERNGNFQYLAFEIE